MDGWSPAKYNRAPLIFHFDVMTDLVRSVTGIQQGVRTSANLEMAVLAWRVVALRSAVTHRPQKRDSLGMASACENFYKVSD